MSGIPVQYQSANIDWNFHRTVMEPTAQKIIELVTNIQVQQLSNVVIKL